MRESAGPDGHKPTRLTITHWPREAKLGLKRKLSSTKANLDTTNILLKLKFYLIAQEILAQTQRANTAFPLPSLTAPHKKRECLSPWGTHASMGLDLKPEQQQALEVPVMAASMGLLPVEGPSRPRRESREINLARRELS